MTQLIDLACVIHCHSTFSDGTGTVAEIAAGAARAGADAVLLTDHDSLEAKRGGEERYYGSVLVCVGEEVSPERQTHYLAFGLEEEIDHEGMSCADIVTAVSRAGGFGFLAHPFSEGSRLLSRFGRGIPWRDLDCGGYTGIELWSFVTDGAEELRSWRELVRFIAAPERVIEGPPKRNLREWDRMLARRPVVAIGGVDAHQIGLRIWNRVPLRLMGYHRSFAQLRTHVLLDRPPRGDADSDRRALYSALRAGRCYIAMDSLADASGFQFLAHRRRSRPLQIGEEYELEPPVELEVRVPRPARMTLLRDGSPVADTVGRDLRHATGQPGVYRAEVRLEAGGTERVWIVSNPIYLR
jgi:hypothetical protein